MAKKLDVWLNEVSPSGALGYMVAVAGAGAPSVVHEDIDAARKEAERLINGLPDHKPQTAVVMRVETVVQRPAATKPMTIFRNMHDGAIKHSFRIGGAAFHLEPISEKRAETKKEPAKDERWYPDDRPWIEWSGGARPVEPHEMCEVLLNVERRLNWYKQTSHQAQRFRWTGTGGSDCIVAYLPKSVSDQWEKDRAEGWIVWRGGECPVAPDDVVEVRYGSADGRPSGLSGERHLAFRFSWRHEFDKANVIAYRVVKPAAPAKPAAPKFEVGDVVYWEGISRRYYGRVTRVDLSIVHFTWLTTWDARTRPIGSPDWLNSEHLSQDFRTVAGGGWRKVVPGRRYRTRDGRVRATEASPVPNYPIRTRYFATYTEDGFEHAGIGSSTDLIEEVRDEG